MKILAFNTTNSQLGVALCENDKILAQTEIGENSNQTELLLIEIEKILRAQNIWYQDLSAIATIKGPGSFSGVRIGLTAAKMIKLATKLPLFTFDSLTVLARAHRDFNGEILAIIDAKMDEFFVAEFTAQNGEIKTLTESRLVQLDELQNFKLDENYLITGSGKEILREIYANKGLNLKLSENNEGICAKEIAFMAFEALKNGDFEQNSDPLYLRQPKISQRKK